MSDIEYCDDGNIENGDGCNDECKIEPLWSCYSGINMKKSQCSRFEQKRTYLEITRTAILAKQAVVEIFLSEIPECFRNKQTRQVDCT